MPSMVMKKKLSGNSGSSVSSGDFYEIIQELGYGL
tara:strand:- start:722 stop:826 length:105 start_codon:yes stop_codon:yes gene_type:complete